MFKHLKKFKNPLQSDNREEGFLRWHWRLNMSLPHTTAG
ncbi:hypothetical protein YPPY72_4514 [Yersinia pestis PY-72]|nr:hypothetical protein YPPY72_4514 [Yersinia pestis PY-72]EIT51990.1 hypothetical protein YPPY102_4448 [Yersinia pestis PY-102]